MKDRLLLVEVSSMLGKRFLISVASIPYNSSKMEHDLQTGSPLYNCPRGVHKTVCISNKVHFLL